MAENKKTSKFPFAVLAGAILIVLAGAAMRTVAVSERKNTLNTMTELADQRVQLIDSFIKDAKETLRIYADAPEIKKMLVDTENESSAAAAQEFTENYAEQIDNLEGIYASELSTLVRTHNNSKVVGMITRSDPDSANKLVQSMLDAEDGICNNGIVQSPASGILIVSLYKLISNGDENYIGFAGLGLKADSLFKNDIPSLKSVENASYMIISVSSHAYIFAGDPDAVDKKVTNDSLLSLCSDLNGTDASAKGNMKYTDENGRHIAAYSYMPEYGMLVMLEGTTLSIFPFG